MLDKNHVVWPPLSKTAAVLTENVTVDKNPQQIRIRHKILYNKTFAEIKFP